MIVQPVVEPMERFTALVWSLTCLYLLFTEAAEVDGALVPGPLLGDHLVLEGGRELDCEVARPAVWR